MKELIIGGTFVLGGIIVLAGIYAFFKKLTGDSSTVKGFGIEVSGTGPLFIIGIGAVMILSGFGWASTQKEATSASVQARAAEQANAVCTIEKDAVVRKAAVLRAGAEELIAQKADLLARIPEPTRAAIALQQPELVQLPAAVRRNEFKAAMEAARRATP